MKTKLGSLDSLRAAASIGILSFHMYLSFMGYWGVSVFFILSAFLMTYNYFDRPVFETPSLKEDIRFALKKTAKLYPLHLLTFACPFLLQLFAVLTGRMSGGWSFVGKAAANVLLLHSLFPFESVYYSFNYSSWFLSSLGIVYLFFPLILRCIRKYQRKGSAWLAIAAAFIGQPLLVGFLIELHPSGDFPAWIGYVCPLIRLGDYIIGCNLAYLFLHRDGKKRSVQRATVLEIFAIVLCAAVQFLYSRALLPNSIKNSTAFIPGAALLIWCFACGEGYISRALTGRAAHRISALSPFVFLIHPVVIQMTSMLLDRVPISYQLKRWSFLLIVPTLSFVLAILYRKYHKKAESIFSKKFIKGATH